jgi:hypothetical protein
MLDALPVSDFVGASGTFAEVYPGIGMIYNQRVSV